MNPWCSVFVTVIQIAIVFAAGLTAITAFALIYMFIWWTVDIIKSKWRNRK